MGVRSRTILVVSVISIVLWFAMESAGSVYAFRAADEADTRGAVAGLNGSAAAIAAEQKRLVAICGDWAPWDDSYQFVQVPSDSYIRKNLPDDTLLNLDIDFVIFTDDTGRIVYSKSLDPLSKSQADLPDGLRRYLGSEPDFVHMKDPRATVSGGLSLPDGAYLIAAQPISSSDFSAVPNGTIIMGYRIRPETLASIEKLTARRLDIFSSVAPMPADVRSAWAAFTLAKRQITTMPDSRRIFAYTLVRGIVGTPGLVLRVEAPRTARATARGELVGVGLVMTLFGLVMVGVLAVALDRMVLRRLTRLSTAVREIGRSTAGGRKLPVQGDDEIGGLAVEINKMLDELNRFQEEMSYLVEHDPLTGLYNRRHFERELQRQIDEHARMGASGAVLWFDLDHFKDINDTLGHAMGDELLRVFGEHLQSVTRAESVVARLGGDEFGMLIPHASVTEALGAAARLVKGFSGRTFSAGEHEVTVSASAGVVIYPEHGQSTSELLARADIAMYDAKSRGGNQVVKYDSEDAIRTDIAIRMEAAETIREALREDRFLLHAQPIRSSATATRQGFELLLRLRDADGKLVFPGDIISTAERLGLISDIDRWLAQRAIRLLALAQTEGHDVQFAINLSGSAFGDSTLLEVIRTEFAATGVEPERLIIEITESTTIADIAAARRFILALREIGCRFSLDDFGSEESSYYYLKHLPIDFLKIDGSLVTGMTTHPSDAPFVSAIVETCRGLNIQTVAEYVESEQDYDAINLAGVDFVQGYHVGVPEPLDVYLGDAFAESGRGWDNLIEGEAAVGAAE
ncbi:MAG: hypothetical protein CVT67_08730 [Actinobacteria bacterium HGW-Actinobacteria-7]|nr:MAG: hypothetical protein CVT67_08730 [Actinobacteria bacterium HGW-Actinobacteria-7]